MEAKVTESAGSHGWPTERLIAAILIGSFAGLLLEIRWEHREAIGDDWRAWIPLVFCGLALLAGGAGVAQWHGWGRKLLLVCFATACLVGALGSVFHAGKHPVQKIGRVLSAWTLKPGDDGGVKVGKGAPALAPGAFVGLGLLGVVVSRRKRT